METLQNLDNKTIEGLKKLVRMNHDAAKGYADSAEHVSQHGCTEVFQAASSERSRFADELMSALQMNDEDVPDGGSTLGLFHRCWLNIRSAVSGGEIEIVLAEAIRGETALIEEYEEVLVETAGSPLNATMQRHIISVRETRSKLEAVQESAG